MIAVAEKQPVVYVTFTNSTTDGHNRLLWY